MEEGRAVNLHLKRVKQNDFATYGRLYAEDATEICVTLEPPWRDNLKGASCIPAGTYEAARYLSPMRGYTVPCLFNVPGRSAIEIHKGNLPIDTEGCILVGSAFGDLQGQPGITGSKLAFVKLMTEIQNVDRVTIGISDPPSDPTGTFA